MKTEFILDFSDFNKKFANIIKHATPESTKIGIREALQALKLDADNIPPRTPHKEGHLRGSGKVKKIKILKKEIYGKIIYGGKGITDKGVAYDVRYARRWHEAEPGTVKWSEKDVGPKFLESKMIKFKNKYMKIVAEIIRRRAK